MNELNEINIFLRNYYKLIKMKNKSDFQTIASILIMLRLNNREVNELSGELEQLDLYSRKRIDIAKLGEIYLRGSLLARQIIRRISDRRQYPSRGVMSNDIFFNLMVPFFEEINQLLEMDNSQLAKIVYALLSEKPLKEVCIETGKIPETSWYIESISILGQPPFVEWIERAEEEAKKSRYKPDSLVDVIKAMTQKEVKLKEISTGFHVRDVVGAGPLGVIDRMVTTCRIRKELREDQIEKIKNSIFEAISTIEGRYAKELVKTKDPSAYYTELSLAFNEYSGINNKDQFYDDLIKTYRYVPDRRLLSDYLLIKIVENIKKIINLN